MPASLSAVALSFATFSALAVAMGIGRFAFTPLLPMMQHDAGLTLAQGGWLASANYLGYFAGALCAARLPLGAEATLRAGLAAVIVTTAIMGLTDNWIIWLACRFVAGMASAWALISASSLCLPRLAAMGRSHYGGWVFAGVGVGIAVAGLLCMGLSIANFSSSFSWLLMAAIAMLGALAARGLWATERGGHANATHDGESAAIATTPKIATVRVEVPHPAAAAPTDAWRVSLCYGLYGFGYILPATFLPAQARQLIPDPALFGLAWPVLGIAAALSTIFASRLFAALPRRLLWSASQLVMAAGVLLPALWSSMASIIVAALCVGSTFMVITMLALQEAQTMGAANVRRLVAIMTASFAAGQLAGPLFFSFTDVFFGAGLGFTLYTATACLLVSCVLLLVKTPLPAR